MQENSNNRHPVQGRTMGSGKPLQARHKVALAFSLLLVMVSIAYWLLFQNELNRSLDEYRDTLGSTLAEQTASSVRELVLVNDQLALNVALTRLVRDSSIRFAAVFNADGNELSSAGDEPGGTDAGSAIYTADITVQDTIAGSVLLAMDTEAVADYQSRLRNLFLVMLGIALVLAITTALALSSRIMAPFNRLAAVIAEKTGDDNDIDSLPTASNPDSSDRLESAIAGLLAEYDTMQERLLESGSWQDLEEQEDEPARLAATILIIKVVNINTAIELLHPATLANLLREYLFYLKQAIRLYGGKFHRLNGDSVMICFTAAACGDRHSINALHCAGLFQTVMEQVNTRHREQGKQMLEFRLAMHSGDVFLAPGITAGGKKGIPTDGILGKTIDIAYFLCNQGKPNELIISESACSQARAFESFETAGENEISMPADNVAFMAYILAKDFSRGMELIRKQSRHILGQTTQA